MKLKFGQLVHATARPVTGDLNGDDQITPADAAIVLAFTAGGVDNPTRMSAATGGSHPRALS